MKIIAAVAVFAILAGAAVYVLMNKTSRKALSPTAMFEHVELKTKDSITIVGDYYAPASASIKGLLLLHMMPADRTSWRAFAEKNPPSGWRVLAIDLRGHGQSQGGPNGYKSFSDEEHQASKLDAEAGVEFLRRKGAIEIYLGGASIGANLALQYLAEHPEAKAAFLLSPGLDYKGIKTEALAQSLKSNQAIYYVASSEDTYSAQSTGKLFDQTRADIKKTVKIFDKAGHGTTIFEKEPQFMNVIASWLQNP